MSLADELAKLGLEPGADALPPEEEARVLGALEAALRPAELDSETNERLLGMALEDPFAPPTDEERVESARLRDALAAATPHPDAGVLEALRQPFALTPEGAAETASDQALETALGAGSREGASEARGKLIYAAFGAVGAMMAAAAVALLFVSASRSDAPQSAAMSAAALVEPHSTTPLFSERFDNDTTLRMDLIASARSRDLRDNRYTSWGVR